MSSQAALLIFLSTVLSWAGVYFGGRWLMSLVLDNQRKDHLPPDPITRHGTTVAFAHMSKSVGKNQTIDYFEYVAGLPGPLADLSIADSESFHRRTNELAPPESFELRRAPTTGDDVFDGVFDHTEPIPTPAVQNALRNAEVRRLLLEVREAYDGLWVQDGEIRVVEHGRPGPDVIDTNVEYLSGVVMQLRQALGLSDGEVVLDLNGANDESVDQPERQEEVVDHEPEEQPTGHW